MSITTAPTDLTTPPTTPPMVYLGRTALVNGGSLLVEISAITDEVVLATDGSCYPLAGATILPLGGECITTLGPEGAAPRRWLGPVSAVGPRETSPVLTAWMLGADGFPTTGVFTLAEVEARTAVVTGCTHADAVLSSALVAAAVRRDNTGAYYRDQQLTLVADAHQWADNNDLCSTFDEFMEDHGMPGRERDFSLRVDVVTTVYLTGTGTSLQEAIDSIASGDVLEGIDLSSLDYTVEAD